jgi:serine/threonine-protein kinase
MIPLAAGERLRVPPFNPPLSVSEVQAPCPGRYARVSELKAGGQGCVFRATIGDGQEVSAGTEVALKVYYADQIEERTDREIAALKRISAPSLVRLIGTARAVIRGEPCLYLETEFIAGECLAPRLQRGPLTVPQIAAVVHDIAFAIEAIWADRIVHRDIKPDNIMLTALGRGVLIDLGVARHTSLSSITTVGKTWGTEGYLSPEQAQGRRALTCKSDIFALGIVAQEALLGRHPTGRRQVPLVATGGPKTGPLVAGLPPAFTAFLDRMVSRDTALRPMPKLVASTMQQFMNP